MTIEPFRPARANRIGAAVVALLLLGSLARSFLRPPSSEAASPAAGEGTAPPDGGPSESSSAPRAQVDFEIQAEVKAGESPPPLRLRLRTRDGVQPAFDVTTRDEPARARFRLPFPLPVAHPELPLRGELVGDAWCIPPGLVEFEVRRLDTPYQLVLARARALDVAIETEEGRPLAGARIVHESGRTLGTTAAAGSAHVLRAVTRESKAPRDAEGWIVQADGFAPALVDDAGPTTLRATKSLGVLRGVVRDATGAAVAGATLLPHWNPVGEPPADRAGLGLWRLAQWTTRRSVPALGLTSAADGRFEVPVAFPGRVTFAVQQRTFGATTAVFELGPEMAAAGATTEVEIRFPRRVPLVVALTLAGAPVAQGRVQVVRADGGEPTIVAAGVADAKGIVRVDVPELPPLFLVAHGDATASHVEPLDLAKRDEVRLELALEKGRAAAFAVAPSGDVPSNGQCIEARDHESRFLLETAFTDEKGRGRFRRLPVGRALDLFAPAFDPATPLRAALVVDGAEADLELGTFELKRN